MKIRNYMRKKDNVNRKLDYKASFEKIRNCFTAYGKYMYCTFGVLMFIGVLAIVSICKNIGEAAFESFDTVKLTDVGIAAASSQRSVISIPSGMVKANPFVPYRDVTNSKIIEDIPSYNLVAPPEFVNENSDAARVMDTVVSGILFDTFSPSAIINIEGTDYLVKKGDVVNNYKVVNIAKDSVTVQLGNNAYKAGIGEILTEGTVNYNNVSNLKNKFGGGR